MNLHLTKRIAITALCAATFFAHAQTPDANAADPNTLIIWVVTASKRPREVTPQYKAAQPGYHASTTGALGQSASSFGHDAGSYGVDSSSTTISAPTSPTSTNQRAPGDTTPANSGYTEVTGSELGQSSGSFGTDSGSHGRTTGSFGQDASTISTPAGSYGQSAGSFGDSLSTVGQPKKQTNSVVVFRLPLRDGDSMFEAFQNAYPEYHVRYATLYSDDLTADLAAASASHTLPDILYSAPDSLHNAGWQRIQASFGENNTAPATFVPDGVSHPKSLPEFAVIAHPTHVDAAHDFYLWATESSAPECTACDPAFDETKLSDEQKKLVAISTETVGGVLSGSGVGGAIDPAIAAIPSSIGPTFLHGSMGQPISGQRDISPVSIVTNGSLAVIVLRVTVQSETDFGLIHPLVVLRKNTVGEWKVLQLSFGLSLDQAFRAVETLTTNTAPPHRDEARAGLKGVTLLAPENNDNRQPRPNLGWDNHGGAGLQIVEWSSCPSDCVDTHLYFVPDHNDRLITQTPAEFARNGRYRWRIWSVGKDGATLLTNWRSLNIQR